jgi:hypothetical protein
MQDVNASGRDHDRETGIGASDHDAGWVDVTRAPDPPTQDRDFPDKILPTIRECTTVDEFTACFANEPGRHVIELLLHNQDNTTAVTTQPEANKNVDQPLDGAKGGCGIEKIRVSSKVLLTKLGQLSPISANLDAKPCSFYHPFQYLIRSQAKMKLELTRMTKNVADLRESQRKEGEEEIEQVRCYVDFVEERLVSSSRRLETLGLDRPEMVYTEDLYNPFRASDFVYIPNQQGAVATNTKMRGYLGPRRPDQRI